MTGWEHFHTPLTIEDALQTLMTSPDSAVIAGGTDLLLDLDQGRHSRVKSLIDISRIEALHEFTISEDFVVIGSAIPLSKLLNNPLAQKHAPALVEACKLIGGPQVRNVATLGGNVAHALPAGDGTIALLAHDAEVHLVSQDSERWLALADLFTGPGEVSFDRQRTLISALRFKRREALEGSAFRRVMRPQGVAIAIMNMGVWLRCDQQGKIVDARISIGPGGPTPFFASGGSSALIGHIPDKIVLDQVALAILEEAQFRTSRHRSTKAYREHLVSSLLEETVTVAHKRASHYEMV